MSLEQSPIRRKAVSSAAAAPPQAEEVPNQPDTQPPPIPAGVHAVSSIQTLVAKPDASVQHTELPFKAPAAQHKYQITWPTWERKTPEQREAANYAARFSGKPGFKHWRRVQNPARPTGSDAEFGASPPAGVEGDDASDGDKGIIVKQNGKYAYLNQFHQLSHKFSDVAVYLSPTNSIPRRLVVQATPHVLQAHRDSGDWIRTKLRGSVPVVLQMAEWALGPLDKKGALHKIDGLLRMLLVAMPLQVLLAIPGVATWDDDDGACDSYTDHPGFHWEWPRWAVNPLDTAPGDMDALVQSLTGGNAQETNDDVRRRSSRPRHLVAKKNGEWVLVDGIAEPGLKYVFISYAWEQFDDKDGGGDARIQRMAEQIADREGCPAYWLDRQCVVVEDGFAKDYDIYTMCDVVRGSSRVALLLGENSPAAMRGWGQRMWTLPEGLLAPGESLMVCYEDQPGSQLVMTPVHKVEMTATFWTRAADTSDIPDDGLGDGGSATRILAEHFSGLLTLSRLELLPAAITALSAKARREFTGSDVAYAVMALLHYRIARSDSASLFQNLARLSLSNDSDALVERLLCLLPRVALAAVPAAGADRDGLEHVVTPVDRPVFAALSEADQFGTRVHHVAPLCSVVGVAARDDTVVLDGARAIHIRWKDFPRAVVQRNVGIKKLVAVFFVAAGLWWLSFGFEMTIYYLPYWTKLVDGVKVVYVAWLVCGFLFVGFLLSAFAPLSVRRLFGGTVLKSKPCLVAFEGVMPLAELERIAFGNAAGRLSYAPSATPLAAAYRDAHERRGVEPPWIRNPDSIADMLPSPRHRLFTLVDTGELSVAIFAAERPPTVALLCGREGGMLRAVLCSWRFETDCLYKETVVRMPSRVYEAAEPKGWLQLCLKTQDQARRAQAAS